MSIKKLKEASDKVSLELDNGHLEALKKITKDYDIKDIENALGFVLSVISKNEGKPIKVGDDSYVPSQAIKNQIPPPTPTQTPTPKTSKPKEETPK